MADVWTDPRTWVDGETPTGAQFNTQFRDNLRYLKNNPQFDGPVVTLDDITVGDDATINGDAVINGGATVQGKLTANGDAQIGDAITDHVRVKGIVEEIPLKTYTETRVDSVIAAGALPLDLALGTYFKFSLNQNVTLSFVNLPAAGRVVSVMLMLTGDGTLRTITWPAGTVWANNVAPIPTSVAGKRDLFTLLTEDGGATWFGIVVGQSY